MEDKQSQIKHYLKIIDEIELVRTQNNVNWMDVLRLAFTHAPDEAKELMKKIKDLKSKLGKTSTTTKRDYNKVRRDTKKLKVASDKIHAQIQKEAKEISKIFDRLTEISNKISEIKKQRNLIKVILSGMKDQISVMNAKLGGVLSEMSKFPVLLLPGNN